MNYILFDDNSYIDLLPITFTRPVSAIRIGIDTIDQKWEDYLKATVSYLTQEYLQEKYPLKTENVNTLINGKVIPDKNLVKEIEQLELNEALVKNEVIVALKTDEKLIAPDQESADVMQKEYRHDLLLVNHLWDVFSLNGEVMKQDFERLTKGRKSQKLSATVNVIGDKDAIFLEKGAKLEFVTLNTTKGPIYIGEDAEVMENAVIRGPFALCKQAVIKMAAKIYGPTTIGPHGKVGGEINNAVFFGNANKGHDGYLGNAVIGEWCNLGADSNNSNLKNNYANVKMWNYGKQDFEDTGLQFCGLVMGDHSKCGINTMFNTGTVVGVNANIFGTGFQNKFIPSFAWGGTEGMSVYKKEKAFEVAEIVMERRNKNFDETERNILTKVIEITEKYRNF